MSPCRKLSRTPVRAITLVSERPGEFDALSATELAATCLAIVPQLVFGCDWLELVFALTARLTSSS